MIPDEAEAKKIKEVGYDVNGVKTMKTHVDLVYHSYQSLSS